MSSPLPPDLETFVPHEVASGNYPSPEEVISDGLRLLRERKLYELRQDIDAGLSQFERGEGIELKGDEALHDFFEDVKRRGRDRLQAGQRSP
jgi:putative addiction module CopG family antidote